MSLKNLTVPENKKMVTKKKKKWKQNITTNTNIIQRDTGANRAPKLEQFEQKMT